MVLHRKCFIGKDLMFWLLLTALLLTSQSVRVLAAEDPTDEKLADVDEYEQYDVEDEFFEADEHTDFRAPVHNDEFESFDQADDAVLKEDEDSVEKNEQDIDTPEENKIGPSPDAQLTFRFTSKSPELTSRELFAGQVVKVQTTFWNRGNKSFNISHIEALFRNASNTTDVIHSFNPITLNRKIDSGEKEELVYAFIPSKDFVKHGRLQLVVTVHYKDEDGFAYANTVFDETMNLVKDDFAMLMDYRFHCILLFGLGAMLFFFAQDYFKDNQQITVDNKNEKKEIKAADGVDFDWIPESSLPDEFKEQKQKKRRNRPKKAN